MRHLAIILALLCVPPLAAEELPAGAVARFGSPALRHGERPLALALDSEGKRLVSGGPDGIVKLWDTDTGRLLGSYKVEGGYASSVAISTDGTRVAARFGDSLIHLLDANTMKATRTVSLPNADVVTLSADGKILGAVTTQSTLHVYEVENGLERLQAMPGKAVAFTPNGARLARAETGEQLRTTDVVSGENLSSCTHLSADGVTKLAWSADGETLLSADAGPTGRIRLWQPGQDKPTAEWVANGGTAFFANESVIGLNDKRVTVWDRTGKPGRTFGENVSVLALSGDGKVAATSGPEPRIAIWDVSTGKQRWTEPDDLGVIRDLGTTADGLICVAAERGVVAWKPGTASKPLIQTSPAAVVAVGSGSTLTVGDNKLSIWPKEGGAASRVIDLPSVVPMAACSSPADGLAFVSFEDKTVRGFNPKSGAVVRAWEAPSPLLSMAVSTDGRFLASVGRDGFARAWKLDDAANGIPRQLWSIRVTRSLRPSVAISADTKLVAVTSVVRMEVIEAATGHRRFYGERNWHDGPFQPVTFSPDGRLVAAGTQGSAGGVSVWDVATGTPLGRFEGGCGSVTKLLCLPDYRLVSASVDGNVLVWELAPKRAAPTDAELRSAWEKLLSRDGKLGFENVQRLAAGGERTLALVRQAAAESTEIERKVAAFVKDLGHPQFATRETAQKELFKLGVLAVPAVAAAEKDADPEVVRRAEKLSAQLEKGGHIIPKHGPYGNQLRMNRAVWALELIGTPAAVHQLEAIRTDKGAGSDDAAAALERLKRK
ncbi:WD40 repeat domain-containing protein [Limnoglobus roseus]|uniref:WD40 repeat domain-containing protein n=1 Tax=Limnoglobus roseus TaxID=2598579 RepID=A0A5C1AL51_9BACT|nr:hypothetical protein [Limnoglobus roseus]QEL18686.1 WD40 repeat domain-containing protein [Limnoglobus roseus]